MVELANDNHLSKEMAPESPGAIGRNIIRRLGLASQVAEAIRSPNNNPTTMTMKGRLLKDGTDMELSFATYLVRSSQLRLLVRSQVKCSKRSVALQVVLLYYSVLLA